MINQLIKKIRSKILRRAQLDNVVPFSERIRLGKLARYQATQTTFLGKSFRIVDSSTFMNSYHEIFEGEIYKFDTEDKDITILDCGANIGLASIYFKLNHPSAKIIAFEPDPEIFKALQENIKSFGFEDIICKNEAVSNLDTLLSFKMEGGFSGMLTDKTITDSSVMVKATRLKSIIKNLDNITFLKIDIEGHESTLLPDIAEELNKVQFMFLEYHSFIGNEQRLDEILNIVKNAGMRYYIKESAYKKYPFVERELFLGMDTIVNIFCYNEYL